MKTVCAFDNVACIVDNFALNVQHAGFAAIVIGFALIAAFAIASIWERIS